MPCLVHAALVCKLHPQPQSAFSKQERDEKKNFRPIPAIAASAFENSGQSCFDYLYPSCQSARQTKRNNRIRNNLTFLYIIFRVEL